MDPPRLLARLLTLATAALLIVPHFTVRSASPHIRPLSNTTWPGVKLGPLFDVAVSGDYAYAVMGENGMSIFRISDPANPMPVGGAATGGAAYKIRVVNKLAYVAAENGGLRVYDVQDPG